VHLHFYLSSSTGLKGSQYELFVNACVYVSMYVSKCVFRYPYSNLSIYVCSMYVYVCMYLCSDFYHWECVGMPFPHRTLFISVF